MNNRRNFKLTLAYEGTKFHGFQIQKDTGLPTIQESVEKALFDLTNEEIRIMGAGRTDAGVHALGQVINFFSSTKIPVEKLPLALNTLLPPAIVVLDAQIVPPDFKAPFQAQNKTYLYQFYNQPLRSPFWRRYAYHVPFPLNLTAMQLAAQFLVGEHNFKAFCAQGATVKSYTRTIFACSLEQDLPLIKLWVTGNGFLYNMVRILAGTILEVGQGKRQPEEIKDLLAEGERKFAGPTLPPQGLFLYQVTYPY
ncbi:MAG TPA: tRNA pseudouridine(38-40) synthase TruA [Clostridia bacterium]|jgi:tRNA pseudouridine38-40 synthase|nr:tRNA pseudouridine(38-40) synthase TruA [Clostridia bacterium]